MTMADTTTRARIVEAADRLIYRQGYEQTSFADIAAAVGISRGNFYHHFKAKDDILAAVIDLRLANSREMLEGWEVVGDTPAERIRCFIRILIANRTEIMRFGCPVGTLSSELAKLDHASKAEADEIFTLFRVWLREQFVALGRADDADALALHLLARSQGIATLANAFRDKAFVAREVEDLCAWLGACAEGAETAETTRDP